MINFLKKDLQRAFSDRGFIVATIFLTVILIRAIILNSRFDGTMSSYEIILNAMAVSGFSPFAAVFPCIGYSNRFCDENTTNYNLFIKTRMGLKKYISVRMFTVGVSGGMVIAIPFCIVCSIAYMFGSSGVDGIQLFQPYQETLMEHYIIQYGDFFFASVKVLLGFLFGVLWAEVSLAVALISGSKYVASIIPFLIYECMWIGLQKYPLWNPIYLYRGDSIGNFFLSGIILTLYIIIVIVFIKIIVWRKINDR